EEGRNPLFALGKAAAAGQGQSDIFTRKRKSGDFVGLRSSVDLFDLLRFTGEETQLLMSSAIRISSACALQVFINPTHCIGSRAFSSSVAPASFASWGIICSSLWCAVSSTSCRCGNRLPDSSI